MHLGKVDPEVSQLPRGNELSRDHVNRPLDHKNPTFLNIQRNIQLFWYSLILKYKNLDLSKSNHLWSVPESQCPRIRFYPKAEYWNLYLALHFDVRIWLQANIEKMNVWKNLVFLKSKFSYLTTGEYQKVGFIKFGEKTFVISETSVFSTWPKWQFVLRRSFCLTQKEILKTSKLKPKMVILVLGRSWFQKVVIWDSRLCERRRRAVVHHHKETFDADVLSLFRLEELELMFRDFHESSETGTVMIGLMSPGTSMMLIM